MYILLIKHKNISFACQILRFSLRPLITQKSHEHTAVCPHVLSNRAITFLTRALRRIVLGWSHVNSECVLRRRRRRPYTTCRDLQACISFSGSLLRIELMMRVGRIINHTFITWIPAAPHWLRGPRGIVIIPRWEMHSAHERALTFRALHNACAREFPAYRR